MKTDELVLGDERIRIACECGRNYKLRSENAGRSFRCRRCLTRLRVPGRVGRAGAVSGRSRAAILREFGIDPDGAESRYWSGELRRAARERRPQPEPSKDEPCITERREHDEAEQTSVAIHASVSPETLGKAALMCAFLVVGLAGFMHTLFAAPMPVACVVALLAALPTAVSVHDRLARAAYRPEHRAEAG